jgi:endonuclease/exonuclease/phosphatase family metal-dependent hydrolase
MRKARGLDQRRRPGRILQVINALDADIVVLQEADKRMGPRLPAIPRQMIEAETDFELVEVSTNGISLGWHGNAVLVRKGIKVKGVQRPSFSGLEPRGAVRVDLDIADGVTVVGAHLGLLRCDRLAQLDVLNAATADANSAVIAGDFNEWSAHKGLEPLAVRFQIHSPGQTFHASRPMAALDRFALSQGLELYNAGVAQDALARRASDHLPIWSDLLVSQSSATC